jgi:N utilization substance protein B
MDHIILITAITEISHFNNIALEISMNEYIELAKEFSGEKSYTFINGILNNIVGQLKRENKIFKSVR